MVWHSCLLMDDIAKSHSRWMAPDGHPAACRRSAHPVCGFPQPGIDQAPLGCAGGTAVITMFLTASYPWIKALHVATAFTFVSGMLASALILTASLGHHRVALPLIASLRQWDQRVTTPAMVATWGLGLGLGLTGHWFAAPWLIIKLLFVIALSAIHGVLSGQMRAAAGGADPKRLRWALVAVLGSTVAIAILAVAKPI